MSTSQGASAPAQTSPAQTPPARSETVDRTATRAVRRSSRPDRDTWIDLGFVVLLGVIALSGLGATFTGNQYLVVGTIGLLLGAAVAQVVRGRGWPLVAAVVLLALAFALVGGPLALRSLGNTAFVPTPSTLRALVEGSVFGWKDLLTTLPPVDGAGELLVLPLLMGAVAGMLGAAAAAARPRRAWIAACAPAIVLLVLLASVILLGVRRPSSLVLQGAAFAAIALLWVALRARQRSAVVNGGTGGWGRVVGATGLALTAAAVALPAAGLVSDDDSERAVARNWVAPPFEIGRYPSPLAGFRRYVNPLGTGDGTNLHDTVLFTVTGAPAGTRMRLAALDRYDGLVWGASDDPLPDEEGDSFQRVSSTIENPAEGERIEATVTLGPEYGGVWMPTAGALQGIEFETGDPRAKSEQFRYNLATWTAVVPTGLNPGDRYSFSSVLVDDTLDDSVVPAVGTAPGVEGTAFLDGPAEAWSGGASQATARLLAVAEHLRSQGKYSDGVVRAERGYHPGHGLYRLNEEFVAQDTMVGNDEQYAAVIALLAQKLGLEARVVMGAVLPEDGIVEGRDIQAWIEIRAADGTWRTLPTESFMSEEPPTEQTPQRNEPMTGTIVPPPNPIPPPSDAGELSDTDLKKRKVDAEEVDTPDAAEPWPAWIAPVLTYVGLPLALLALFAGGVLGAKAWRRRRRRTSSRPASRVVGAWREVLDEARDLGRPVPSGGATRRQQADVLGGDGAVALARRADGAVFGPEPPAAAEADSIWDDADRERRQLRHGTGWWRRTRAALSPRSLLPSRNAAGSMGRWVAGAMRPPRRSR